jgi:hypothetical protein
MISCEEASIICNKTQYKEASFLEKMKLRFHILFCKACAAFTKKNGRLTALCQKARLRGLSEEEKLRMKKELGNQM